MIKVDWWLFIEIPLQTNRWTDGQTDGQTDRQTFAIVELLSRLKNSILNNQPEHVPHIWKIFLRFCRFLKKLYRNFNYQNPDQKENSEMYENGAYLQHCLYSCVKCSILSVSVSVDTMVMLTTASTAQSQLLPVQWHIPTTQQHLIHHLLKLVFLWVNV